MLNIGGGEIALILIVALLLLGPKRMPELARGLGKFLREFRRQTDDVRTMVEREFYRMDEDVQPRATAPKAASPSAADLAVPRPAPAPSVEPAAPTPAPGDSSPEKAG
jgi:sec-independent protein translocase protein TatB